MNLNYILIASADKPSLKAFLKFIKNQVGREYIIGDMHSLMSEEAKELYVDDFTSKFSRGVFVYYAKGVLKSPEDPTLSLPKKVQEICQVIVWFDLYSTEPRVLKDTESFLPPIIENWKKFLGHLGP